MPSISMLIKPASSLCNMRCKYCFYSDEAANRGVGSYGIMTAETTEAIIKRATEEATGSVTFAFQGGEPTIAGISYYDRFCEIVKKYNTKNLHVNYAIQTNGIFSDAGAWAELFRRNNFLVGLSFDGTRQCHDLNRIDASGQGTASRVITCAAVLEKHKVDYNILTVVNSVTARHITKIYAFYKKQDWKYMQFIPCLAPLGDVKSALTPEVWLDYNKTLFDLWYSDNKNALENGHLPAVSVRHLDDYLRAAAGLRPESCGMLGICTIQNVIEADGGVYPCDFWALDEYKLGNINENSFRELFECECAQKFIKSSCIHDEKCRLCRWYKICMGGCARMKHNNQYIYCEVNKTFLEYTYERIIELSNLIMRG
jgi:uncharacterized protein